MSEFQESDKALVCKDDDEDDVPPVVSSLDLEEDIALVNLNVKGDNDTEDSPFEATEVSSFRKRFAEAQITDNLSESACANETIDLIAERVRVIKS